MIVVALRGLAARKLRAALTALAVLLGVAMISGTYVLTDTMLHAFDTILVEASKGTDAIVLGHSPVRVDFEAPPPVPASLLERIRALPQTEVAMPFVQTSAKLVDRDGKTIGTMGAPTMGMGVVTGGAAERFNPLELTAGRWARSYDEVVIDARSARDHHFAVGDTIRVAGPTGTTRHTVVGIARFAGVDSIGGATMAIFDLDTAQGLFDRQGLYDSISVAAKPGVSPEELAAAIRPVLPTATEVQTAAENVAESSDAIHDSLGFIRWFLLAFGAVALFVGAFTIFNTLSITVAQRTRELATLRTLGASRRQVMGSVMVEALAIGVAASVIGLFAGLGLGAGLNALFVAFGIDTPQVGLVLASRTVLVSIGAGVVVTLLASVVPALRATRVPPIAAVREGAVLPRSPLARYVPFVAPLLVAGGAWLLVRGAILSAGLGTAARLVYLGVGGVVLFVGVAMLSTRAIGPLASVIGRPAEWLAGSAGRLARENAARNPGRTAVTAAALMVGLALVTFVAVVGAGMRGAVGNAVRSQVRADYVLGTPSGFETLPPSAGLTLDVSPGIIESSRVRFDQALVRGDTTDVTGLEARTIADFYRFDWVAGSSARAVAALDRGGALVTKQFAERHGLAIGDPLVVVSPSARTLRLRVAGVYAPPKAAPLLGDVAIGARTFDLSFPEPRDLYTFADAGRGAQRALIERTLEPFPDAQLRTLDQLVSLHEGSVGRLLSMMYALLALSVIVSVFGIVNTLVLSVVERTREIGMLRAVGMSRRQVRRMVRAESVITSCIGAALGIALGMALAGLTTSALSDFGVGFSFPGATIAILVALTIVVGVVAAAAPARRASRLDVLRALHYE